MSTIKRFVSAFFRRLARGEVKNVAYLTYYYSYLFVFDRIHKTNFTNSHSPTDMESGLVAGTGNFPGHPRLIKMYIDKARLPKDTPIIDVGHGSGIVLFTASRMGYTNLTGIEHAKAPYDISVRNIGDRAKLIHGDAFKEEMTQYEAIFFFSPFRGELAEQFFSTVTDTIHTIITVNHDRIVEPHLERQGFKPILRYQHPIYSNFNGVVWKR